MNTELEKTKMDLLDQNWLKDQWRTLVELRDFKPLNDATRLNVVISTRYSWESEEDAQKRIEEQTKTRQEAIEREQQGIADAYTWILEQLQQHETMESYFKSLYQNRPSGTWAKNIASDMISSIIYELRGRYGKHISNQLPRRYKALAIPGFWIVYDTETMQTTRQFSIKSSFSVDSLEKTEKEAKNAAEYCAETKNGYHLCIGNCSADLPHIPTRISTGKLGNYQHGICQICGTERILS